MPSWKKGKSNKIYQDKKGNPRIVKQRSGDFFLSCQKHKFFKKGEEKVKKKCFSFLICMFMLLPGLTQAKDEEPVSTLDEMVVTASRVPEKKRDLTTNVTVIDENDIKLSAAKDLGDLLSEKAGVYIRKYPGNMTSIGLRGFRTETHGNDLKGNVLILLNGRRAGTGNAAKIMTKNIERVEIIRGPAAVQYGSAAMGGLVNVITKQGKDKPTFFAEGLLGSYGYEEGSAGFSGKIKNFDFSGSFTRTTKDDYDIGDGDKYDNTGYDEKTNCSLNLGYEFLPGHRIGMIYTSFDADKTGSPYYFLNPDPDSYADNVNESIDFIYDGTTADGLFSWKARYFNGEDDYKYTYVDPLYPSISKNDYDQEGAQGQVTLDLENFSTTIGVDWLNYDYKNSDTNSFNVALKSNYENTAGFMLAKLKLFDQKLIISGGLRYDEYDLEFKQTDKNDEDDDNWTPSIGLAYLVNDCLKIRANYAEAFVMPAANEMAGKYTYWYGSYIGNPDLDPETSKTYEAGFDFSYSSFNSSITYFYTDFKDKIEDAYIPGDPAFTKSFYNINDATISGFEGEFSCNLGTFFDLNLELKPYCNITYLDEYESDDAPAGETHKKLKYTSEITASYGILFNDLNGLSANLNFSYTGKQNIEDHLYGSWPSYQIIEKGGFTVANITISKKIYDFSQYGKLTLKGEIENLFDKDYSYVQGYPMPGRSFYIGLRYDY